MQFRQLIRNSVIEAKLETPETIQAALKTLDGYIVNDNLPYSPHMRREHAKLAMELMVIRGQIRRGDSRFYVLRDYYSNLFQEDLPAYGEIPDVTIKKVNV